MTTKGTKRRTGRTGRRSPAKRTPTNTPKEEHSRRKRHEAKKEHSRRKNTKRPVGPVRPPILSNETKMGGPSGSGVTGSGAQLYDQRTPAVREWDRATQWLSCFAISAFLSERTPKGDVVPLRPASVLLVGGPGSGKTELIERFKWCYWMSYHNDLTVRSLLPLLRRAEHGVVTHVAAPEFNKWFQRKAFVAENCVGLLSSAMEEGIDNYSVGGEQRKFNYARLGLFAGCTPRTMGKRKGMLSEMGFLTRAAVLEWELPRQERDVILQRMNVGTADDTLPIRLRVPSDGQRAVIAWNDSLGAEVIQWVKQRWPENDLRTFKRYKTLMMARAYLTGQDKVSEAEYTWLRSYDDYWDRLILSDE